jgi:hypothetical protein
MPEMRTASVTACLFSLLFASGAVNAEVFCTGDGAGGFRCVENGKRVVAPPPEYRPASAAKRPASAPVAAASAAGVASSPKR